MNSYKLGILIPHFNNPEGLYISLESVFITVQTVVVVVDDGSDDRMKPSYHRLLELSKKIGFHLIFETLTENRGIENALNYGLVLMEKYEIEYLARLDCGDICHRDRFAKQINFLDSNLGISLVGAWAQVVDEDGKKLYVLRVPEHHKEIKRKMNIAIAFVHPTILFRHNSLSVVGYYPHNFSTAEDYAFLFKFVNHLKTANIQEVLLYKERSSQSISTVKRRKQLITRIRVIATFGSKNLFYFYGIIRTMFLFLVPYRLMEKIKENLL